MSDSEPQPSTSADGEEGVVSSTTGETDGQRGIQPNQPEGDASHDQPGIQPNQPQGAASRDQRRIQRNRRVWVAARDEPEGAAQQCILQLTLRRERVNRNRVTSRAHDNSQIGLITLQRVEGNVFRVKRSGINGRLVFPRQRNRANPRQNNGRDAMPEQRSEEDVDSENSREGRGRLLSSLPENILLMDLEMPDSHICTTCNEVFKTVVGMKTHRTKIHLLKENRSVQCKRCSEIFPTIQHFTIHKSKCLRERKDETEITEGNTATHSSVSTEQSRSSASGTEIRAPTNTRNVLSSRRRHSKNAALAEAVHSDPSHVAVPSSRAPYDRQQPAKKRKRYLPPEQEPELEVPSAENYIQKSAVKEVSSSPYVPNLLLRKKDKKALKSRANKSCAVCREQVEEQNLLLSAENYRVNYWCHSGKSYKRKRSRQLLQNGSSVVKKRRYEENCDVDSTAGPSHIATVGSQFALKGCHVLLPDIGLVGELCSVLDTEEETELVEPEETERAYSNREGQDKNSNGDQLAALLYMISACSSADIQSGEESADRQLRPEDVVKQVTVEGEESEVRATFPQTKCVAISKQTTESDGSSSANSEPSLEDSEVTNVSSVDGMRSEYPEDSDSQISIDSSDLPSQEDPENENTLQCINTKTDNFISADSITDTLTENDNYGYKQFPGDRISESSSDNESFACLETEQNEQPLESYESHDLLHYSLSGTNSSVPDLSICDAPSQVEMLHTIDTQTNSEVQPDRIESSGDAIALSVSHPSTHHSMTDNEQKDLCIGSPAQHCTDTERQIFSNTFFDELLSLDPSFTGEISGELPDLSLSLNTGDTNDISYNHSFDCAKVQENNVNHNEETGSHSTYNESCISLGSGGQQQKNTSQNSSFIGDEYDTVIDQKTHYKSMLNQKIEDSEIPKLIFDDDNITETSQSTLGEEETCLKKINDWETKTASSPEFEKVDEAQTFSFYTDSSDIICTSQTGVSSKSQSINTSEMVNSDSQQDEEDLISSIFLSDENHEGTPSNDGSSQETFNTDTIEVGGYLTHDNMMKLIPDDRDESNGSNSNEGTRESHRPNSSEVSECFAGSTDTEFFISSDDSQFVEESISENSSEAVSNSGTDSSPGIDCQVLTDSSNWSPLSNNSPLLQDLPLNPKVSPDHGVDLTFDQPADTNDCNTVNDEFFRELISSNFPQLMDQDFTESGSADEATNDIGTLNFEDLNFDLLVMSPADHSDWIKMPEKDYEKEEIGTDPRCKLGPSIMEHNEVVVYEGGNTIDNGIGCSTVNYNMFTNNNVADSNLTEIAGETHTNPIEWATDSMEVDNYNKRGANEIISQGSQCAVIDTQSPSEQIDICTDDISTETAQYNMEMDMNLPDQDTITSLIDSLTKLIPSCITSPYRDPSDNASHNVLTEDETHCKNTASSSGITFEVEKRAATKTNLRKKAKRYSSHVGTSTAFSTGVFEQVNLNKSRVEIHGAHKHQNGESEITRRTKNLPLAHSLAKTAVSTLVFSHTVGAQPGTCRDNERIRQKGGIPHGGNLAATSDRKPNEIPQTEEILALSVPPPQQAAEGTSRCQTSDLSQPTEESQHKGSAAGSSSQMDNKSQFASRNANRVLTTPLAQKSQEAVLLELVKLVQAQSSDGKTAAAPERGSDYMLVKRAPPDKTPAPPRVCHCGRRFQSTRSLHQHQTRSHFQTRHVRGKSKGGCDGLVHSLPHKRYECPCGSIFRSAPAAFNCCLEGTSQRLTVCRCKLPKARRGPSALHKSAGKKAN